MRNKFIKTLCSFQIGVNVIGLPLYLEIKGVEKTIHSFVKTNKRIEIFTQTTV